MLKLSLVEVSRSNFAKGNGGKSCFLVHMLVEFDVRSKSGPRDRLPHSCVRRNEMLTRAGLQFPKPVKTGTTIAGVVFKDGIVLGADTRATEVWWQIRCVALRLDACLHIVEDAR